MQFNTEQIDVAIVGGGIVGLSMALALSKSSLNIAIIDPSPIETIDIEAFKDSPFEARVSALTLASESLLDTLGVWHEIVSVRVSPYSEMFVWDADGTGSIHFNAANIHHEYLGHIVENSLVSSVLSQALNKQDNIRVIRPDKLKSIEQIDPDHADSRLELQSGHILESKLVIAADGSNSFVRKQANFETKEWDYQHQAIVTTVRTQKPHKAIASQCFMNSGPLAFLPLHKNTDDKDQQRYSSIVWSCVPDKAEALMALDDKSFALALGEAFEFKLGEIEEVQTRHAFPLWQKHATDYVQEGIALIGDAAHSIHPLAGQGVNLGLLDVAALTQVIIHALEQDRDFASHQVLSRYQRQRKANNLGMMLVMEGFKRLFASDDLSLRWIRNTGIKGLDDSPILKNQLMRKAMGL